MAKGKTTAFFCKECGYETSKWLGQCPGCKEWNTFVEELVTKKTKGLTGRNILESKPVVINEVDVARKNINRIFGTRQSIRRRNCTRRNGACRRRPGYWKINAIVASMQKPVK